MKEHILITSNFSSDTGFAWKFFFRLFNEISGVLHDKGIGICLSFARVVKPVTILDEHIPFQVFTFDPLNISLNGVLNLRRNIKKHNITYGYFTDFPSWHWLYLLMRWWGMKKIIVHNHISVAAPYPPSPEQGIKKILKSLFQRSRLLSADSVFVCSEFVKDRLVRKACCPEDKIEIILHGIDIDRFVCPKPDSKNEEQAVNVFCVARATKHKGVHILIEAAKLLRDKHVVTDFVVRYGGDGPDMQEFKNLVVQYHLQDYFIFLGALADTPEETCKADIVVVPSCWGDALPLSVIEAMAAKKAVVATDVGGVPEEIGINTNCGILIKPGDAERLAAELADLIVNPERRKVMGENARKRAEVLFTEERFYDSVLSNLLRGIGIR